MGGCRRFQYAAGAGHDGHLERGVAALVRVGAARTGGFGRRGQALRRARVAGQPYLSHAEGIYLLASDWLLCQASEGEDLSPAEQQHLDFHLRQFVDAMSPTLLLARKSRRITSGGRDGRR